MKRFPRVLIVGGGISGLATAWWLAQSGARVEVWERATRPGGKIETTQHQGYQLEQAAALLLNFRPEVAELVQQSGLEPFKNQRTPLAEQHRYLLNDGELQPVSMRFSDFILSKSWSLRGRLRMMMEPLIPKGGSEEETVSEFITRRFGHELLEKAMDPFVSGTLASDPDLANAASTMGRLTALEQKFGSLTLGAVAHRILKRRTACVTETFSFEGGMSTLIEQLAAHPGITLHTGRQADQIEPRPDNRWRAVGRQPSDGKHCSSDADHLILSTPAATTATLLSPLSSEASQLLQGIDYAALKVLHTGFDRSSINHPLDGSGFLTPRKAQTPFNGNLWMSSLFRGRAPRDKALLTTYLGGARHPEIEQWSEAEVVERTLDALQPILGISAPPEMITLHHHHEALPLYHGHYAARIKQLQQQINAHTGLHLAANYIGGVSVRDRIAQGRELAQTILAEHTERASINTCWDHPHSSVMVHST